MREILPGLLHWTMPHPKIKFEVSSYFLADARVLIDPLIPMGESEPFADGVEHIILTNRHHYRDSGKIAEKHGCKVWCVDKGMHEFTHGEQVEPFAFGDTLPGDIESVEIGAICPDETALVLSKPTGVIAVADGLVRMGDGPLAFVPDEYMGDDPEAVKAGLKESYANLCKRDFDTLLLAHGDPWIGGARDALRKFVSF